MKTHTQLSIPEDSAWSKKTYNPIVLIRRAIYSKWPHSFLDRMLDKFIFNPYENIKNGLVNFWEWKSVIWKDKHWDDHFIFEVLKQKLILQRKCLVSSNRHTLVPQANRDITICLNLIERIQDDYYEMEHTNYVEDKLTFIPLNDGSNCSSLNIEYISDTLDDYFKKYKLTVKKCLKADRNLSASKRKLARAIAGHKQTQCQQLLFKILSQRITWWWD